MIRRLLLLAAATTTALSAQGTIDISIGVRETGAAGGTFSRIGGDGGFSGGIEWVNLDGQTLTLDGTWQRFTFDLANDPITAFAGPTANGTLEGPFGTLEHIRFKNNGALDQPIQVWIDDVTNTTTTNGSVVFGDFERFNDGDRVMFQDPTFGAITPHVRTSPASAGVDNFVASRTSSDRIEFQFVDNDTRRWLRLTTYQTRFQPNPLVRFDDGSQISFWMRGGRCQPNLGVQGPGSAIAEFCGAGLAAGQASTYYTARVPGGAAGAVALSLPGGSDVSILGGTLVSFGRNVVTQSVVADPRGRVALPVVGTTVIADVVVQSAFLDASLPLNLTFTNAVRAEFGR